MAKANQLAVDVRFVPLPTAEMDERRERLRALVLRGALRTVRQQLPTMEPVSAGPTQE